MAEKISEITYRYIVSKVSTESLDHNVIAEVISVLAHCSILSALQHSHPRFLVAFSL